VTTLLLANCESVCHVFPLESENDMAALTLVMPQKTATTRLPLVAPVVRVTVLVLVPVVAWTDMWF
jgi:hypothetical protein